MSCSERGVPDNFRPNARSPGCAPDEQQPLREGCPPPRALKHFSENLSVDCGNREKRPSVNSTITFSLCSRRERVAKRDHKVFVAGSVAGLKSLVAGQFSPKPAAAVPSPSTHMSEMLSNPPRKHKCMRPTPLRPDFIEPDPFVTGHANARK